MKHERRLGAMVPVELFNEVKAEVGRRGTTIKDVLIQVMHLWLGTPEPALPAELPKDMNREEALLCAQLIKQYRSSDFMKKIIPHSIRLLQLMEKD